MAFSNDEKQEIKDIVLETMTEQSDAVDYTEQVVEFAPGDEVPIVRNGDGTGEKSYGRAPVSMFGGGGSSGVNGIMVRGSGQVLTPTSGVITIPAYEDGAEKNPVKYLKEATISQDGNSLTIKDNNNETKTFTPIGGGGSSVTPSDADPLEDGTKSAGSSASYSRGDHRHPHDTTKADKSEMAITPGTGENSDKTTIQLKDGLSTTVLTQHKAPTSQEVKNALGTGSGTTKYLREDGEWATPPSGGGGGNTADVNYDTNNKKITKTIDGVTSDVVTVATLKTDMNLGNVGNFKAVSTVANQGLSNTEKSNARTNIGAGTSNFSGSYDDLTNKPTIPCADKSYAPLEHSGLGRKNLELNGNSSNILTQADFSDANTIYVVQYDFDLNGQKINIPEDCVLEFDGGSLTNGWLISNDTKIIGVVTNYSALYGVFYDENGDIFMWNMHKLDYCNSFVEFGNGSKDVGIVGSAGGMAPQGFCMTNEHIFLFHNNGNTKGTILIYDRSYNLIGNVTVNISGHYNDATIYDNYIYVANGTGYANSLIKISISNILSAAQESSFSDGIWTSPAISAETISGIIANSIDYDPITNTFCLIPADGHLAVYDTNFNLIRRSEKNINTEVNAFITNTIVFQSFVYRRGMVYLLVSSYGGNNAYDGDNGIMLFDLASDKIVHFQRVNNEILYNECEGLCVDPLTNNIYTTSDVADYDNCWRFYVSGLVFNSFEDSKNRKVNLRRSTTSVLEYPETSPAYFNRIWVDNNYTETISDGSAHHPYKTVGEAIALAGSTSILRLYLKNSDAPYFAAPINLFGKSVVIEGESTNGVVLNSAIHVTGASNAGFSSLTISPLAGQGSNYGGVLYFSSCSNVGVSARIILDNVANAVNCESSSMTFNSCVVEGNASETASPGTAMTKSLVRAYNSNIDILSGTYSHLNLLRKWNNGSKNRAYLDQFKTTITNCALVYSDVLLQQDPYTMTLRRVADLSELANTINLMKNGSPKQVNLFVPHPIQLENGATFINGIYLFWGMYGSEPMVRPISMGTGSYSVNVGFYGSTSSRPTNIYLPARQEFYDTTLHKMLYWTGDGSLGANGWLDALGNNPDA